MPRKMTQECFIDKASKKYPNLNFSKVNYVNNWTKVHIICSKHGDMYMSPNQILCSKSKYLCKKCSIENGSNYHRRYASTNDFLERFKELYPDPYNYFDFSKTIYNGIRNDITITCPIHGDIITTPFAMLLSKKYNGSDGKMCIFCKHQQELNNHFSEIQKNIKIKYPQIELKTKELLYRGNNSIKDLTVDLFCTEHKRNIKIKYNTLKRYINNNHPICCECGGLIHPRDYSTTEFVDFLKTIYPDKNYDYSNVNYINWKTKIEIICPNHGVFYRLPSRLAEGRGCPYCKESLLEREIRLFLISNKINFIYQYRNKSILGLKTLDFFLPDFNAAIECQGKQHLKIDSKFNVDNLSIENIYNKDYEKFQLCKSAGIKLFYYTNIKPDKKYFEKLWYDKLLLLENIINDK